METNVLDESKLHALTSTIEKKLKATEPSKRPKDGRNNNAKRSGSRRNKQEQDRDPTLLHNPKEVNGTSRGKKRTAGGQLKSVIQREEGKHAKEEVENELDETSSSHAQLLRDIVALDGTEEDLALVADVDSASELEWDGQDKTREEADRKLRGDLTRFMKDLGIEKTARLEDEIDIDRLPVNAKSQSEGSTPKPGQNAEKPKDAPKVQTKTKLSSSKDTSVHANSRQFVCKLNFLD